MAKLRKLVPDEELFRRRAREEPLRDIAPDYGVCHTTLGRYVARPEAASELKRVKRLIRAEQRAAEADRRAQERAQRTAQRRLKQQPLQTSSAAEPPPPATGETRPRQPDPGRPIRKPTSVALPPPIRPAAAREGFPGFLDRIDADRAARVGRAPGQPANSALEPRDYLAHQVQLAKVNRDPERQAEAERVLREWDAR